MATFKPGQRVKVKIDGLVKPNYVGKIGTFIGYNKPTGLLRGFPNMDCEVLFDGQPRSCFGPSWSLAPLVDPKAEEFVEKIKNMCPDCVEA